jgi:hypothetical protein
MQTCKFKVVSTYHFIVWEAVAQQENTMRVGGVQLSYEAILVVTNKLFL